jgi:hypothetical protein
MTTDKLNDAIAAIRAGDKALGRQLLLEIVKYEPSNETAWLWLSACVVDIEQKKYYLSQALEINPSNQNARKALAQLQQPPQPSVEDIVYHSTAKSTDSIVSSNPPRPTATRPDSTNSPSSSFQTRDVIFSKKPALSKKTKKISTEWVILGIICSFVVLAVVIIGVISVFLKPSLVTNPVQPSIEGPINTPLAKISLTNSIPTITLISTPKPFKGKWQVFTSKSEFDNSTTVTLSLDAENYVEGWLTNTLPTLVLRCEEKEIDVFIDLGTSADVEYGLYDSATVRVRFDQNQAIEMVTNESTDNEALFFSDPYGMIISLLQNREMVFGFTPFNADPVVTKFDLQGLAAVIEPLKQSCSWNGERPTISPLPTIKPTSTPLPTPTPLPIGSIFTIELQYGTKWQIIVKNIEISDSLKSIYDDSFEKAAGRFAIIFMDVTNRGLSPDYFSTIGLLNIQDATGQIYETNIVAETYANDIYPNNYCGDINPDATVSCIAVYDISKQSNSYTFVPGTLANQGAAHVLLQIP